MLKQLAEKSLRANFEQVGSSFFLTAGRNQFRSLWVRDFCFSVPALLAMDETPLVRDQLDLIWSHQNEAGLFPRGLDSMSPKLRVLRAVCKLQSRPSITKALQYLLGFEDRGLLLQPKFSDWQDSVRRKGKTSFVNLWWW